MNTDFFARIVSITVCTAVLATGTSLAAGFGGVQKEGEVAIVGVEAAVTVVRDGLSVPSIQAASFDDAIRALGFVHAQERFFQMDAARRVAAGELAELVPALVDMDRQNRPYRFRYVASEVLKRMDERERHWLEIYAQGVNAGIEQMPALPLEYSLINMQPQPWKAEDSILVYLTMFQFLHMEGSFEKRLGVMHDALPEALYEFLTPNATRFDEPLVLGDGLVASNDWEPLEIPGPDAIDLRAQSRLAEEWELMTGIVETSPPAFGSNNWAVAGSRSVDGRAILANDPHLRLSVPGIWYRAELRWGDRFAVGVTLPGTPGIVIGSNGRLAWGFTNMMGDFQDLIIVEVNPENPEQYRTPDGWESFETVTERINIRGRGAQRLPLRKTRWGIVTDEDYLGRPLVLKWTALDPDLVDMGIMHMSFAETLEQGVDIAAAWGGPAQNILLADDTGRIAWVISGHLPKRFGYDGRHPVSWADGDKGWDGMIPTEQKPRLIDPSDGILFTANNRTMSVEQARTIGGVWTAGERANRIARLLREGDRFTEDDLFEMQLDTRVSIFDFYRDLALQTIDQTEAGHELDHEARQILLDWNGTADADQPAVQLLQIFRHQIHTRTLTPLLAPVRSLQQDFVYRWFMDEEPVRRLLEERPMHLLSPRYGSWDELIETEWRNTLSRYQFLGHDLNEPWGKTNAARIEHPLTMGMPMLADRLNLQAHPQPGHPFALRVATPSFGASARLVVSPGREQDGYLHVPAGQSGHPQSPHYRDAHAAWAEGQPLPLLPGEPNATLRLLPQ